MVSTGFSLKMRLETDGAIPAHPDFDVLRAGLSAAQAATPTAMASAHSRSKPDSAEALVRVFGEGGRDAAALRGSFNPGLVNDGKGAPER